MCVAPRGGGERGGASRTHEPRGRTTERRGATRRRRAARRRVCVTPTARRGAAGSTKEGVQSPAVFHLSSLASPPPRATCSNRRRCVATASDGWLPPAVLSALLAARGARRDTRGDRRDRRRRAALRHGGRRGRDRGAHDRRGGASAPTRPIVKPRSAASPSRAPRARGGAAQHTQTSLYLDVEIDTWQTAGGEVTANHTRRHPVSRPPRIDPRWTVGVCHREPHASSASVVAARPPPPRAWRTPRCSRLMTPSFLCASPRRLLLDNR